MLKDYDFKGANRENFSVLNKKNNYVWDDEYASHLGRVIIYYMHMRECHISHR